MSIVVEERPREDFVEASEALGDQVVSVDEQLAELYGDLRYQDVSVEEQLSDIMGRVVADNSLCKVNPLHCLHKIREEIYGEIDRDQSSRIVGRIMHAAGDDFSQRKAVLDKLDNKDFSFLSL